MALVLRDTYPDIFRAAAAHSGVAPGLATNAVGGLSVMQDGAQDRPSRPAMRPTLVLHGTADDVVHPTNATCILRSGGPADLRSVPASAMPGPGAIPRAASPIPASPARRRT